MGCMVTVGDELPVTGGITGEEAKLPVETREYSCNNAKLDAGSFSILRIYSSNPLSWAFSLHNSS